MDTTMQLMTPDRYKVIRRSPPAVRAAGMAMAIALSVTACGDDSGGEDTIPLSEWLEEFEELCSDAQAEITPDMTEAEFAEVGDRYRVLVQAITPPDEMADTVTELIDVLFDTGEGLDDAEIQALDERVFEAFTALGISDSCTEGG
jgi:hypothetical protein